MRKLPLVKYISNQVADQLEEDGEFNIKKRTISIRKGMSRLQELEVYIHEQLHFIQQHYKGYIVKMNDAKDLSKNETDKMAKKILKLILQERYKELIKNL